MTEFITTNVEKFTDSIKWITKPISLQFIEGMEILTDLIFEGKVVIFFLVVLILLWKGWKSKRIITNIIILGITLPLIHYSDLWHSTSATLSLVIVSVIISFILGVPIGVLSTIRWTKMDSRITPIWSGVESTILAISNFMQTMPSYVYLIPAFPLFGLGYASACFATVVFSTPPLIRMVHKGFLDVPYEIIEASNVDGASYLRVLFGIQFPLSWSTIAEGINQSIMMALSMSVISSLIGAKGLGSDVWRSIQRLRIGDGIVAGLCMVSLALLLDQLTKVNKEDILEGSIK